MQRVLLVVSVSLIVFLHNESAPANWQVIKAKWDRFWDRVHLDWHRNNAWPEPFSEVDRRATRAPIERMVEKGWELQNTIPNELFDPETQELTAAGELKVRKTLTEMPLRRRMVFVQKGKTAEITHTRLKSVEKAASKFVGEGADGMVSITSVIPQRKSGDYYQRMKAQYEESIPAPRLPEMEADTAY
ncbi:MAG: hypothetical protein R6U98_34065 [Pirellulaceae bacterium]